MVVGRLLRRAHNGAGDGAMEAEIRRIGYSSASPGPRVCSAVQERFTLNSRPPVKPAVANEPFKHVIDEYKHQAQTITCTCGWHGSSQAIDRGGSEWTAHLIEVRGKKR